MSLPVLPYLQVTNTLISYFANLIVDTNFKNSFLERDSKEHVDIYAKFDLKVGHNCRDSIMRSKRSTLNVMLFMEMWQPFNVTF